MPPADWARRLRMIRKIDVASAASSTRNRKIANGEVRKLVSALEFDGATGAGVTAGDGVSVGVGVGVGVGDGVGVADGIAACTSSWAHGGEPCCWTQTRWPPVAVLAGTTTSCRQLPEPSVTAPPSTWSALSR
jgi:hypothetical protein